MPPKGVPLPLTHLSLTHLSEEDLLLRNTVRRFAREQIQPLVREMDDAALLSKPLLKQLFALGLMGIEIPENYGGGAGTFFESILAIEEISRVDPSAGVLVDVQNTLVNNALLRWGNEEQKRQYLPRMAQNTVGAYALSEAGSGSDAFAMQTRAELYDTIGLHDYEALDRSIVQTIIPQSMPQREK